MIKDFYDIKDLRVVKCDIEYADNICDGDYSYKRSIYKIFYVDNENGKLYDLVGKDYDIFSFSYNKDNHIKNKYLNDSELQTGKISIDRIVDIYNKMNNTLENKREYKYDAVKRSAVVLYNNPFSNSVCCNPNKIYIYQIFSVCNGIYTDIFRDSIFKGLYKDKEIPNFNFSDLNFTVPCNIENRDLIRTYYEKNKEFLDFENPIKNEDNIVDMRSYVLRREKNNINRSDLV